MENFIGVDQQIESIRRLADFHFEWVLPGHGERVHLPAAAMREQVLALVERMREASSSPPIF